MNHKTFRFCLIGQQSLLIQCAEILLTRGHTIRAVISDEHSIRDWANKAEVSHFASGSGLVESLAQEPFDYLFSVANLSIISNDILALPRLGAINFHDGPLPRYAGLHATSWALINEEKAHGVTWHKMTKDVDAGDALKQHSMRLSADETALSLNAACFQAGIQTFEELIKELEEDCVKPRPQNLQERHYFGKYKRPDAACVISWSQPADTIGALVRALHFGPYRNPLGLPKLLYNQEVYYVHGIRVLDSESDQVPGSVVSADNGALIVSTGTRDVELYELVDSKGQSASTADLVDRVGVQTGDRLIVLDQKTRHRLTKLNATICREEEYWIERLTQLEDLTDPYANPSQVREGVTQYSSAPIPIPDGLNGEVVTAAFALYLARLSETYRYHIGYSTDALRAAISGFESIFAAYIPVEVQVDPSSDVGSELQAIQGRFSAAEKHMTYSHDVLLREPRLRGELEETRRLSLRVCVERVKHCDVPAPQSGSELSLLVSEDASECRWVYSTEAYSAENISRMQSQFSRLLQDIAVDSNRPVAEYSLVSEEERRLTIEEWNSASEDYDRNACIHHLFEKHATASPDSPAVIFKNEEITYGELNSRANQLAAFLRKRGVGPDVLVGIYMERSLDMMVGLLAILKAGGAYLPLDPGYPSKRIAFMIADANVGVLVTQSSLIGRLPAHNAQTIRVDGDWSLISGESVEDVDSGVIGENLSYVIYTSGSTGKPKGVMVRHRNVINFFLGMDEYIPHEPPGIWLAVTSLSFDISVLELLWTLARGFEVVLYTGADPEYAPVSTSQASEQRSYVQKQIDLSLFYFASDEGENAQDKYKLLIEGAKFADENGFSAVWTPERHFHAFGGLYPNPAVASAAIAVLTRRVKIRAGSCVLPLHNPIRIAEEWSLVDNLSKGRVGISFASGWHPNDFVIAPQNYAERNEIMIRGIDTVRKLWRGETISVPGPTDKTVEVSILPRPIQPELPVWVTAAGNPETFRKAGENGANLLTHLLGQSVDELTKKLEIYRQARRASSHGPGEGHVTLMLHTFVADSEEFVRSQVHQPLKDYLRSAAGLIKQYASSFPAFKKTSGNGAKDVDVGFEKLSDEDMEALLEYAFNRYYETSGLFGTPEQCVAMVNRLKQIGVDEIACLIDFGVPSEIVLKHLPHLNRLRELTSTVGDATPDIDASIPALINRHRVTHLQCTPSMATMLTMDEHARESLRSLSKMLVGGEAFPPQLASDLRSLVAGDVINMYGPTETTIWSTTHTVDNVNGSVPIGRPIANTQLYVLNKDLQPVPVGVPGELLIAGEGVVRGYHDRPQLTSERFIDNPFVNTPGARMYRTGDLVRYRPDGVLEFLGRIDHQVKIRGHRIELGEIEAVLSRHAKAKEVVVTAHEDPTGDKRLVAYCVPMQGEKLSAEDLREFLRDRLPAHMVPSAFVTLDALPLTPNGKVDRQALPKPDQVGRALGGELVAPRTQIEKDLVSIWRETLSVKEIGIRDSFFDLGGDSLSAVKVAYLTRQHFQVDFPLQMLFQAPTVEQLAEALQEDDPSRDWASVVPLQPNGSKPPFFFLAGRSHFGDRLGSDQPVYRVVYQDLDREQPLVRIEDMAAHSIKSIRTIQPDGPYYLGGHDLGGLVAFEMAQQLQRQGEKVAVLALCESWPSGTRPPAPGMSAAYRLWQRAGYHFHRARHIGPRQELTDLLVRLKTKTQRAAWRRRGGPRTRGRQGYRAAAYEALRRYVPQTYSGRIAVFRCAERVPWRVDDPLNGWGPLATDGVDTYEIPGSHTGIYKEPHLGKLASTLKDVLHKAQARAESERMALADPSVSAAPITSDDGDDSASRRPDNRARRTNTARVAAKL